MEERREEKRRDEVKSGEERRGALVAVGHTGR